MKTAAIITKTLRLRVIRPLFPEHVEILLKEEKERRVNTAKETLGHEPKTHEEKMQIKNAKHISTNDPFWQNIKNMYPNIILWSDLGLFLKEYQKVVATSYNESMTYLYLKRIMEKSGKSLTSLLSECTVSATRKLGSSYVALGLNRKLKSNFREVELKYNKISLPTMKADSVAIPINVDSGFRLNLDVKKKNSQRNHKIELDDFTITLPLPNYEVVEQTSKKKDNFDKERKFKTIKVTAKKNDIRDVSLILGVKGRKKNKTWNLDKGTDAEIRRIITVGKNGRTEHENKWIEYLQNLQPDKKAEIFNDYANNYVRWKTIKKEFNISDVDEQKEKTDKAKYIEWKKSFKEKYLEAHPISEQQFTKKFLKQAKITYLEIIRGKKNVHGGTEWFINFVINLPPVTQEASQTNPNFGGIDIGVSSPIVCAVNDSLNRYAIKKNDVVEHNRKMKARTRIFLSKNSLQRKGHGAKNKMKAVTELNEKSEMFKKKIIERWSSEVVNFFKKEKVGKVQIEDLSSMKGRDDDFFNSILRITWPYAQMQDQIKRKLEEEGIKVISIDPFRTSQFCSSCHKRNEIFTFKYRKIHRFPSFNCEKCGYTENADYNAARNIANPEIERLTRQDRNK